MRKPAKAVCSIGRSAKALSLAMLASGLAAQERGEGTLTDTQLIEYVAQPYSRSQMMDKRVVLGLYHGVKVVADFPCSDICPAYTRRLVHYDVPLSNCDAVDGLTKEFRLSIGSNLVCVPKVLADKWDYGPSEF